MRAFAKNNDSGSNSNANGHAERDPFFGVQAKLTVGKPNDKYEKEADSMADTIVSKSSQSDSFFGDSTFFPASTSNSVQKHPFEDVQKQEETEEIQEKPLAESITPVVQLKPLDIQEKCASCEDDDKNVQTKGSSPSQQGPSINFESKLSSSKGSGSTLSKSSKSEMESGFGADLSNVRIHTDSNAVAMNKEIGAQAFTNGSDIYFNEGKYSPESSSGKHLLAHELTHTIQQGGSSGMAQNKIQRWPGWADSAAGWVSDTASSAASSVANGATWVGGQVADGAAWVGGKVADGAGWVGDQLSAAADWLIEKFNETIDSGTNFLNDKWERIEAFGTSSFDDIKKGFSSLAGFITSPMSTMITALSDMNADILEGTWNVLKTGGNILLAGINFVINSVLAAGDAIWGTVSGFIDGIFDTIDGLLNNTAFNLLPDFITSGLRSALSGLRSLWNRISSFWTDLWGRLTSFAREIVTAITSFIGNVINHGIAKVISMVRGLKEVYDYIMEVFSDPKGTIAPYVEAIAAMLNEQGPGKSEDLGKSLVNENYSGESAQSSDNGVVQRVTVDGEERTIATPMEVIKGVIYYIADAWANMNILDMLWQTVLNMFWPPATLTAIVEQFSNLWNDDWATAYNSLYMPRNLLVDPLGCLHDIWSNYLILLDFPLALWRTINNIIGLLMGYVTIFVVLGQGALGAAAGAAAGGIGAVPGFFAGVSTGMSTMAGAGVILMGSVVAAEGLTVVAIISRLFMANQTCEKRQVDIKTSVASFVTMAVAGILALLLALLARLLSMIAEFLKGTSRGAPAPAPIPKPDPAPGLPAPKPGQPVTTPKPGQPVEVPVPQRPQLPQPRTQPGTQPQGPQVPVPHGPQPTAPVVPLFPSTPQPAPAVPVPIAAKFENDEDGTIMAQMMSEKNEETTLQTKEEQDSVRELYFSQVTDTRTGIVQTSRSNNIDPNACNEDDDCENIVVPRYAPQDKISHEHASRNGGVSNGLSQEVTGIRALSGYKELEDYKGNNIAGFIYEVYENMTDYLNSDPIQIATIVRRNDDIHSEERIVSELVEIKKRFPSGYIIKVDQIATERSSCSTCYNIIRGNPNLTRKKIYTQNSGIYYIVKYNARNWKQNAKGLRAAYCGTTTIQ